MTNPAVKVTTTTEVGYCPFCRRTRNLRSEVRHLGALVRTNVDCESCHRTLSSTIGPPAVQAAETEPPVEVAAEAATPAEAKPARPAKPRAAGKAATGGAAPKRKAASTSRTTSKSTAKKK